MSKVGKGLHDVAHTAGGTWRTISVSMSTESLAKWTLEIKRLYDSGKRVIVRANHGYGPERGTIPVVANYDAFVYQLESWVSTLSPHVHSWQIGSETNLHIEWPDGQRITPADYAHLFHRCRNSIKAIQPNAIVMPAAVSPGVPQWQDYWAAMVNSIECDAYSFHCYSQDYSRDSIWNGPAWHTYREMLAAIPENKKHLPVYITEANGGLWKYYRAGWLSAVMGDLEWWNNKPETQKIHAITFYAYDERGHGYGMSPFGNVMEEYEQLKEGTGMTEIRLPIISKPEPASPPDDDDREWDSVLNVLGVKVIEATVPPGKEYWKLVSATWQDAEASGGRHHIYTYPDDLSMRASWPGEFAAFTGNYPMYNAGNAYRVEPNTAMPHDAVEGLGMGTPDFPKHKIHTSFVLKWKKVIATGASPELRPILSLVHPVADPRYRRVTQKFGARPEKYEKWGLAGHEGVDFGTPEGQRINAAAPGRVSFVGSDGPYGTHVRIEHDFGVTTYAHLSVAHVTVGRYVKAGEPIGLSGNTGNSESAHLHFSLWLKSESPENGFKGNVDPEPFLQSASTRVGYITATAGANIRNVPVDGKVLTAVPYGEQVGIIDSAHLPDTRGWLKVRYKEYEGWMHPTLVGANKPAPVTPILEPVPVVPTPVNDTELFNRCLTFVLIQEGGWADDPNDVGGATHKGITIGTYTRWRESFGQPAPTKEDLRNIPDSTVRNIYYEWYWLESGADDLPWPNCLAIFDLAVNGGPARAKQFIREVGTGFIPFMARRIEWYTHLDGWPHFSKGWIRRCANLMKEAVK